MGTQSSAHTKNLIINAIDDGCKWHTVHRLDKPAPEQAPIAVPALVIEPKYEIDCLAFMASPQHEKLVGVLDLQRKA